MEDWKIAEALLANTNRVMLTGPPGVGKTYAAQRYQLGGRGVYSITCTPDTPASEIRGNYFPTEDGNLRWQDGVGIKAMREGSRLVLNEISQAGPDLYPLVLALTDCSDSAHITLPTGETVKPSYGYQVVATDNARHTDLAPALQSRFATAMWVGSVHPDALALFPAEFHGLIAMSCESEESREDRKDITLRHWLEFFKLRPLLGIDDGDLAALIFSDREMGSSLNLLEANKEERQSEATETVGATEATL